MLNTWSLAYSRNSINASYYYYSSLVFCFSLHSHIYAIQPEQILKIHISPILLSLKFFEISHNLCKEECSSHISLVLCIYQNSNLIFFHDYCICTYFKIYSRVPIPSRKESKGRSLEMLNCTKNIKFNLENLRILQYSSDILRNPQERKLN